MILRSALVVIVALVGVAACGSDGDVGSPGTHLQVEGVATAGVGLIQPGVDSGSGSGSGSGDIVPSTAGPDDAVQVPFSGSVTCDGAKSTGSGIFETTAVAVCLEIANEAATFGTIGTTDDQVCAEIYGGPQHVTIKGSVAGAAVDLSVDRSDGCGIDEWQRLEWLIGPPER